MIANPHLRMRLIRMQRKPVVAHQLPAPVDALETLAKYRAQSLLIGVVADRAGGHIHASDLTPAQARDVIAWATPRAVTGPSLLRRVLQHMRG